MSQNARFLFSKCGAKIAKIAKIAKKRKAEPISFCFFFFFAHFVVFAIFALIGCRVEKKSTRRKRRRFTGQIVSLSRSLPPARKTGTALDYFLPRICMSPTFSGKYAQKLFDSHGF
ncbi:MAG: hypothetical protein WBD40_02865 [Tepidisphaeraceae bacterium]